MVNDESLEYLHANVLNQQSKIDNKANVFIALNIAITGFIIAQIKLVLYVLGYIPTAVVLVLLLISTLFFYSIHAPQLKIANIKKMNVYHFGSIANFGQDEFYGHITSGNLNLKDEIIEQIYKNSIITQKKYKRFKFGLYTLAITIFLTILIII